MELRQLRYFIEVAEREHFTEAAEHLHVAQSAISIQISKLESELGVTLFERTGRNIKLTQIGNIFLTHIKEAVYAIDYAKSQVDEYLDPENGTIKIGYPTSLANNLLPTVISAFREKQPNVSYHLRQGSYAYLIDAVKKGELGLAFLGPVPTEDPELETHILFSEDFSALVPATHPLAQKDSISLGDLRNDNFVLFPEGYILEQISVEACHRAGFGPNIIAVGEDMDAIKGLVAAGIGISILPNGTFPDITRKLTVKLPIDNPKVQRTVGMVISKTRELAPTEKIFYQFVQELVTTQAPNENTG